MPSSLVAVLGLGIPELIVITIVLAILAGLFVVFVWGVARVARGRTAADEPRLTGHAPGSAKKCPDCAELVQMEARVCKHCGYRFANAVKTIP